MQLILFSQTSAKGYIHPSLLLYHLLLQSLISRQWDGDGGDLAATCFFCLIGIGLPASCVSPSLSARLPWCSHTHRDGQKRDKTSSKVLEGREGTALFHGNGSQLSPEETSGAPALLNSCRDAVRIFYHKKKPKTQAPDQTPQITNLFPSSWSQSLPLRGTAWWAVHCLVCPPQVIACFQKCHNQRGKVCFFAILKEIIHYLDQ